MYWIKSRKRSYVRIPSYFTPLAIKYKNKSFYKMITWLSPKGNFQFIYIFTFCVQ